MAVTSPDSLRTPNPGDPYNLVADLAILAQDTQDALTRRANVFNGTVAQRTAFTSTATDGMLWQDTDGIKMIWRKDGAAWVPAVWRWSGSTAQMNAFTQAPAGFEWLNTTDGNEYIRLGGSWQSKFDKALITAASGSTLSVGNVTREYSSGRVWGEIRVQRSSWVSGATIATIPAGFRPPVTVESAGAASGVGNPSFVFLQIGSSGQIMFWASPMPGSSSWCAATFTYQAAS